MHTTASPPRLPAPGPHPEIPDSRIGAFVYDPVLWFAERRGMSARRRELLADARGTVLEIGAGTGLNLRHYSSAPDQLVLAEPASAMAARITRRMTKGAAPEGVDVQVVPAPAEDLPFPDDSFDTVVSTLVLCTVGDPNRAVDEVARVLRPGGQLLFLEHVRADGGWQRRLQRRSAGAWAAVAGGCRCDRPTLETIADRLEVESARHETWSGMPTIVKPLVQGRAVSRG